MNKFLQDIENRILIYDGSKGYLLQKAGLPSDECSEMWNTSHPEEVKKVYASYKEAGSDVIQTNTFPGNRIHFEKYGIADRTCELNYQGARLAREVMGDGYVAASVGPTGLLYYPSGELSFDKAYDIFKEQIKALVDGGVDIINFETFTDVAEMRAALIAARDVCNLPVICSMSFESNGRTLMGSDPYTAGMILKSLGASMIGTNCSFGPEAMVSIVEAMSNVGGAYLSVKPNAGLPDVVGGCTVYKETAERFAFTGKVFASKGARLIGGCCGTTPEFIWKLKEEVKGILPVETRKTNENIISSSVRYITITEEPLKNVGRLDASEDREFKEILLSGDLGGIEDKALDIACEGYDAVLVRTDTGSGDDNVLPKVIDRVQGYVKEPLIIETSDTRALEKALRLYKGIAGVIVGRQGSTAETERVAAKYGSQILKIEQLG